MAEVLTCSLAGLPSWETGRLRAWEGNTQVKSVIDQPSASGIRKGSVCFLESPRPNADKLSHTERAAEFGVHFR